MPHAQASHDEWAAFLEAPPAAAGDTAATGALEDHWDAFQVNGRTLHCRIVLHCCLLWTCLFKRLLLPATTAVYSKLYSFAAVLDVSLFRAAVVNIVLRKQAVC